MRLQTYQARKKAGFPLYVVVWQVQFWQKQGVHRPWKKSDFFLFLAFDYPKPRTYNPRPRCFAAVADEVVLPLNLDAKIV